MPYLGESTKQWPVSTGKHSKPDAFHALVKDLSDVLGPTSGIDSADVNPQDLIDLMEKYTSKEQHWFRYAFADSSRNYTRNLVDEGNGKSNLLVIVWNPGKGSAIHDHANAHCVMKILKGSLKETVYTMPDEQTTAQDNTIAPEHDGETVEVPVPINSTTYHRDEVTYISDNIGLHKITNPSSTEVAVSLHLYTPPHAANYGFNMFCEKTGKQTHCKQAGVYSDRGKLVPAESNGSM